MDKIDDLRLLIDKIDDKIMSLLDERFSLSAKIGKIKAHTKTNILDTNRENIILDKTSKYSHYPEIDTIYKVIMEKSKSIQRK